MVAEERPPSTPGSQDSCPAWSWSMSSRSCRATSGCEPFSHALMAEL